MGAAAKRPLGAAQGALIGASVCLQSAAWACMKWAARGGATGDSFPWIHPAYVLALGFLGAQAVAWLLTLKLTPLSAAYPFMALSIPLNVSLSILIFGERVGPWGLAGLAIITVGVVVVASGARS